LCQNDTVDKAGRLALFQNDSFGSALSPMYKIDMYQSAVGLPFLADNTILNIWIYNHYL